MTPLDLPAGENRRRPGPGPRGRSVPPCAAAVPAEPRYQGPRARAPRNLPAARCPPRHPRRAVNGRPQQLRGSPTLAPGRTACRRLPRAGYGHHERRPGKGEAVRQALPRPVASPSAARNGARQRKPPRRRTGAARRPGPPQPADEPHRHRAFPPRPGPPRSSPPPVAPAASGPRDRDPPLTLTVRRRSTPGAGTQQPPSPCSEAPREPDRARPRPLGRPHPP